jgi:regulator of cell morphogenesis and NO signaling
MKIIEYNNITVGEIVANNFRTAEIFKNAGIDFCCGGKKSLSESCIEKGIDLKIIQEKLIEAELLPVEFSQNFKEWDINFLCDYIVNTHHKFVLKNLPELAFYTMKIASVHGDNHPELKEIEEIFAKIKEELSQHLKNEEEVLFPAIKEAIANNSSEAKSKIISEIARMSDEHEFAGGAMDRINDISKNYALPIDACNTYQVTFKLLKQFEDDLHVHVHLENNILYPKALSLTKN